jgi:hypothetical protein
MADGHTGRASPRRPGSGQQAAINGAGTGRRGVHAVAIAGGVVNVAARAIQILLRHAADDPETGVLLRDLDTQLLGLETMIAASLPHAADSFDDTMSALAEVHRHRETLKAATQKIGSQDRVTPRRAGGR